MHYWSYRGQTHEEHMFLSQKWHGEKEYKKWGKKDELLGWHIECAVFELTMGLTFTGS